MLKRLLYNVLSEKECSQLYSAFDQIGNIIIIRIPQSLLSRKKIIGQTLLDEIKTAESIFCQSSDVHGDYRTRDLELLAGADNTQTEYKEYGCRFTVDIKKAFFSPRLSTERERIANLVNDGEIIINMFAGIGMFSIMMAKKNKCKVYSIDINPAASALCEENITKNKMAGSVVSINDNASKATVLFQDKADRTLMLLPERSDEFLESAINTTKNGGIIHYYSHIFAESKNLAAKTSKEHYMNITPVESEILNSKIVRVIGPRYYQTVLDVRIKKSSHHP